MNDIDIRKLFFNFLKVNNIYFQYMTCFNYYCRKHDLKDRIFFRRRPEDFIMFAFEWGISEILGFNVLWSRYNSKWIDICFKYKKKML